MTYKKKAKPFLNNKDMQEQIRLSKEQGKMNDELAKMCMMLVDKYAKHPNYAAIYSYKEDMIASAYMALFRNWKYYNPDKSDNPFAYFTQIAKHEFYRYLNMEKKQRGIRNALSVELGVSEYEYEDSGYNEAEAFGQSEPKPPKEAPSESDTD